MKALLRALPLVLVADTRPAKIIAMVRDKPLDFRPGEKMSSTPNAIAAKLATIAHGGTVKTIERKETALPKQTLEKYVGTYEAAPGMRMWGQGPLNGVLRRK